VIAQSESTQVTLLSYKRLNFDVSSRVNAVETLYSAFPAFMFIDPGLGALLLEPLFRVQASSFDGSTQYADEDLGTSPRKLQVCDI
jgi:Domain of unknown function (DUF4965)